MVEKDILDLPTPRLLTYYKKYYRHTCKPFHLLNYDEDNPELKAKADDWYDDAAAIKTELDTREHVEKKHS